MSIYSLRGLVREIATPFAMWVEGRARELMVTGFVCLICDLDHPPRKAHGPSLAPADRVTQ